MPRTCPKSGNHPGDDPKCHGSAASLQMLDGYALGSLSNPVSSVAQLFLDRCRQYATEMEDFLSSLISNRTLLDEIIIAAFVLNVQDDWVKFAAEQERDAHEGGTSWPEDECFMAYLKSCAEEQNEIWRTETRHLRDSLDCVALRISEADDADADESHIRYVCWRLVELPHFVRALEGLSQTLSLLNLSCRSPIAVWAERVHQEHGWKFIRLRSDRPFSESTGS